MDNWGDHLLHLIKEANYKNVSAFAEAAGISRGTLSHILHNQSEPSLGKLLKILNALPFSTDYVLFGTGPKHREEKQESEPTIEATKAYVDRLQTMIQGMSLEVNQLKALLNTP